MFFTYEYACTAIHRSYVPQLALNEKVCVPETCNSLLLADYLSSFDMSSQPSTMTKKKRIAEVGRSLRRSSTMNLCSKQAQLEQVAQDHTQLQFQISPGTETPQTFQASCSRVWLLWPQWKGFFLCLNVISSVWMYWLSLVLLGLRLCKLRVCSRQSSQPLVCNKKHWPFSSAAKLQAEQELLPWCHKSEACSPRHCEGLWQLWLCLPFSSYNWSSGSCSYKVLEKISSNSFPCLWCNAVCSPRAALLVGDIDILLVHTSCS